jgi:cell division protein ZipA
MENLRWILLAAGSVIVLGIYLFGLYKDRKASSPQRSGSHRTTPVLGEDNGGSEFDYDSGLDDVVNQTDEMYAEDDFSEDPLFATSPRVEVYDEEPVEQTHDTANSGSPDKVFTLYVMAPRGVPFRGPLLLGALADASLEYGDMQIFHRTEFISGQEKVLFSVANIKEPGIFDLSVMQDFTTEGLVLFLQVPGSVDSVHAFDAMVESARILANHLDSAVCDATRSVLTNQTISHMREEVISCQLQQRVANAAS